VLWDALSRFESTSECGDAENVTALRSRGFALARGAVRPAAVRAFTEAFGVLHPHADEWVSEVPARFNRQLEISSMRARAPALLEDVAGLLSSWHAQGLLPSSVDMSGGGISGTSIRTSPAACSRADHCAGKWHLDPRIRETRGSTPYGRQSNVWLLLAWASSDAESTAAGDVDADLSGEPRAHGNLVLAPLDGLARLLQLALARNRSRGEGEPAEARPRRWLARCEGDRVGWCAGRPFEANALRDLVLETVGCQFGLRPGDALYLDGETYHRTQDMGARRAALRLSLGGQSPVLWQRSA
jgi:hypothetical protein